MNLTGKILTFLILFMSVVFMSFAVAVYATHQNWYMAVNRKEGEPGGTPGLKVELEKERAKSADLKNQLAMLEEEKDKVETERKQVLASLEHEKTAREKEQVDHKAAYDKLESDRKEAVAAMDANQNNLRQATAEVENLRKEIRDTQQDRDKQFEQVVKLTEEVHQTTGEVDRQKERNAQLAKIVARDQQLFKSLGIKPETPPGSVPPLLRGKVLALNKEKMIEIDLGSDDGLQVGHKLEVFRGSNWLAKVEVLRTDTDHCVAKIVPGFQKGPLKVGDDVATRFKNDLASRAK